MNAITWFGGLMALTLSAGLAAAEPERFETPDAAVAALIAALEAGDRAAVLRVFGPKRTRT